MQQRTGHAISGGMSDQIERERLRAFGFKSNRTLNCLLYNDVKTIDDLTRMTEYDLARSQNVGRKTIKDIKEVLQLNGLSLRPLNPPRRAKPKDPWFRFCL